MSGWWKRASGIFSPEERLRIARDGAVKFSRMPMAEHLRGVLRGADTGES
jgi:hypothetical protein